MCTPPQTSAAAFRRSSPVPSHPFGRSGSCKRECLGYPLELSATTSVYDGESNCPEHEKQEQVADGRVDDLLPNVERPQLVRQGQVQEAVDELHTPEGCQNGASCLDCQAEEGQKLSSVSHNFDGDDINEQNYRTEPCLTSGNGHLIVDSRESELPNNIWEGESYHIFESLRG
ncbi:hypothetical protein GBA52_029155 [Prunus armeniaca]|nr:hypothetical protein GBA52_029155 [Prunus armeniaca]